jgi:polyisoprenoid-binding protein YceI
MLGPGAYRLGADTGHLLVRTFRTGLGSKAGHDLVIEATDWHGTVKLETDRPDSATGALQVTVDGLQVREGHGGVKPLTDGDRAEIRRTFREKILQSQRYPQIAFRVVAVRGNLPNLIVQGELRIRDAVRELTVPVRIVDSPDGDRLQARAQVRQSDWGIKPYSAFLGALKLRDEVDVEIDAGLVAAG